MAIIPARNISKFSKFWTILKYHSRYYCQIPLQVMLSPIHILRSVQTCSQGPFSTSRKYPGCGWSRIYACQPKPHRRWVFNLILSTFSREVNVGLLYGRYFEKEASYLSEILPGQLLRLYLNFYEYEILIETELCSYFTASD